MPDKDIYYQLIRMFPHCDSNQIRKLLIQPPFNPKDYDRQQLLELYIDQCLNFEIETQNLDRVDNLMTKNDANIVECINMLQHIFPNADPGYLSEFAMNNFESPEKINQFIEENLVNAKYPTIDEFLKKAKFTKFQHKYINNFDVEKFLQSYRDPVGYFENEERKCSYNIEALNFLINYFNFIQVELDIF